MPKRLPEEISQAVRELKAFETEKDHMTRCEHFNEGIESLDEYLYFCQEPRHVKQAENIKFTYTKKLLQELQKLTKSVDREEWFSYYFSLLTAQKEVD